MNKNFQLISALSLAAALTACGGGSSGGGSTLTSTAVSGTASKGIIIGGTVTAYPLVNGVIGTTALGSATTGADGKYTLELPADYDGSPVVITVEPATDGSTLMRCDIPSGCGTGVSYGDDYTLAAGTGFSMSAILPEATAGETVTVNPTPLTNVAASVALDALSGVTAPNDFAVEQAIADANSSTADRFGITGDLNEQPVIDITDPVAVAAATPAAIIYNSLPGAIVEATQDDDGALSVEEALDTFVTDYVDNGGISGNTATAGTTSLEEILDAAQEVLTETSTQEGGGDLDLTAVTTTLTTETTNAGAETPDTPDDGEASETASDGELAQVKAMVSNLRDVGASVSIDLTNSASAFATQIEIASIATEAGTTSAMDALTGAGVAVSEAINAYSSDVTLTTHTASNGLVVGLSNIVATETETTVAVSGELTVSGSLNGNTVAMTYTLGVSGSDVETGTWAPNWPAPGEDHSGSATTDFAASLSFEVVGTVTNSSVELEIVEGSIEISATIDETENWDQSNNDGLVSIDEEEQFDATLSISFDLEVSLAQQVSSILASATPTDPVTFVGTLGFSVQGIDMSESETYDSENSPAGGTESETWDSDTTFDTLNISFGGTFTTATQSFGATFALSAAGNGVVFSDSGSWEGSWSPTTPWQSTETEESSNTENTSNYADLSVSLSFEATLTGITDPVSVTFGASRTGLEEGEVSLDLAWEGNHLDFDITGGETGGSITLLNQDGVSATFAENAAGEVSGAISNGGSQYATIDELGVIRYVDGNFESL